MPADVPTIVFREWGKANGFRRAGTTLYRDQEETVAVVNLQGSQYGGALLPERGGLVEGGR